ncbi:hypothetical protein Aduo_003218 [Ancylostoma duodenale]
MILKSYFFKFPLTDAPESPIKSSESPEGSSGISVSASTSRKATTGTIVLGPTQVQAVQSSTWFSRTLTTPIETQTPADSLTTVLDSVMKGSYEKDDHPDSTEDELDSTTIVVIAAAVTVVVLIIIIAIIGFIYEKGQQKRKRLIKEQLDKEEEAKRRRRKKKPSTPQAKNKKKRRKRHKRESDSSESISEKKKKKSSQRPTAAQQNVACDPKAALANYLEAQLQTCRLAIDPEKAGGDTAIKPGDLKDDGYFGIGAPR